jgi:nicotinamide-nucleotide amidase
MMSDAIQNVAEAARGKGIRVAVAESLTCGLLAGTIGKGANAEEWFAGGIIAYQTRTKVSVLGVTPGLDPVSADCAEQMARGARDLLDSDIAVSTTGVGGPGSDGEHPAGTVFLGWATAHGTGHSRLALAGDDPEKILEASVDEAIVLLASLVHRA